MLNTHAEAWSAVIHANCYQQVSLWSLLHYRQCSKFNLTDLWAVLMVQASGVAYSEYRPLTGGNDMN